MPMCNAIRFGFACLAAFAAPVLLAAADELPNLQAPAGGALISNPGTADTAGYRIVVLPSGKAEAVDGAGHSQGQLSADLAGRFFQDVREAMPLSKLRTNPCLRSSASVLPVFVSWRGEQSPDVSCRTDAKATALDDDVKAIARTLYVAAYRKRSVSKFGSGEQSAPSLPASAPAPPPPPMPSNPYPHGY